MAVQHLVSRELEDNTYIDIVYGEADKYSENPFIELEYFSYDSVDDDEDPERTHFGWLEFLPDGSCKWYNK